MATWTDYDPTPSGVSFGSSKSNTFLQNRYKIKVSVSTARGVGDTYYVKIKGEFDYGEIPNSYVPPDTVYYFASGYSKGITPPTHGASRTWYLTATGGNTSSATTIDAGISKSSTSHTVNIAAFVSVAIPKITTYTVAYNANGGTGTMESQTKVSGEDLVLSPCGFTKERYAFVEWNTKADGTGTSYAAGASYTDNAAVTLYAQWEEALIPVYINVGNQIYEADAMYINVGNQIYQADGIYINVGGSIKQIL